MTMEEMELRTHSKSILASFRHFTLYFDRLKEHYGKVCSEEVISGILNVCQDLQSNCIRLHEDLFTISKMKSEETLESEIKELSYSLLNSLADFKDLMIDFLNPNSAVKNEIWKAFIKAFEEILKNVSNVLIAWDHFCIRKIHKSLDKFLECVSDFYSATSHASLTPLTKTLVLSLNDSIDLLKDRASDLSSNDQRNVLSMLIVQLQNSLPLLTCASVLCNKYTLNPVIKSNRDIVTEKFRSIVEDIKTYSNMGKGTYEFQESGIFTKSISDIFDLHSLFEERCSDVKAISIFVEKAGPPLEIFLQHSIAIAQISPLDHSDIVSSAENVLKYFKSLSNLKEDSSPDPEDLKVLSDWFNEYVSDLEYKTSIALHRLIIKVFHESAYLLKDFLKRLGILDNDHSQQDDAKNANTEDFDTILHDFDEYIEGLSLMTGFVVSCIQDGTRAIELNSFLTTLEWLEPYFINVLKKAYEDRSRSSSLLSRMIFQHLMNTAVELKVALNMFVNPIAFTQVIIENADNVYLELRQLQNQSDDVKYEQKIDILASWIIHLIRIDEVHHFLSKDFNKDLTAALEELVQCQKCHCKSASNRKRGLFKRARSITKLLRRIFESLTQETLLTSGLENAAEAGKQKQLLSDSDKKILNTSNLSQIPVDSDTPRPYSIKEKSEASTRIINRIANSSTVWSQRIAKTKGRPAEEPLDDISIDITKHLNTLSLNTFRSSKRNFSLMVKEIHINFEEGTQNKLKEPVEENAAQMDVEIKRSSKEANSDSTLSLAELEEMVNSIKEEISADKDNKFSEELEKNLSSAECHWKLLPDLRTSKPGAKSPGEVDFESGNLYTEINFGFDISYLYSTECVKEKKRISNSSEIGTLSQPRICVGSPESSSSERTPGASSEGGSESTHESVTPRSSCSVFSSPSTPERLKDLSLVKKRLQELDEYY